MILQYWQVLAAHEAAKQQNPETIVGSRINYQFFHEAPPGEKEYICGLFGWIVEHKNPMAAEGEPMELVLAIETSIDEWYVTQEVKALWSRENLAGDCTNINQADRAQELDDIIFGNNGEQ